MPFAIAVALAMAKSPQSLPPSCFLHYIILISVEQNRLPTIAIVPLSKVRNNGSYKSTVSSLQPTVEAILSVLSHKVIVLQQQHPISPGIRGRGVVPINVAMLALSLLHCGTTFTRFFSYSVNEIFLHLYL